MKHVVCLIAAFAQLLCLIVAAAKYGCGAGILALCAVVANSIQAAMLKLGGK